MNMTQTCDVMNPKLRTKLIITTNNTLSTKILYLKGRIFSKVNKMTLLHCTQQIIRIRKTLYKLLHLFCRKEQNNLHEIQFLLCINNAIMNMWYHIKKNQTK